MVGYTFVTVQSPVFVEVSLGAIFSEVDARFDAN